MPIDVSLTEASCFGREVWFGVSHAISWDKKSGGRRDSQAWGKTHSTLGMTREVSMPRIFTESVLEECFIASRKMVYNRHNSSWVNENCSACEGKLSHVSEMCLVYFSSQPSAIHKIGTITVLSSLHTKTTLTDSFPLHHLLSSLECLQPITSSHGRPSEPCSAELLCFYNEVVKRPWVGSSDLCRVPRLVFWIMLIKKSSCLQVPW